MRSVVLENVGMEAADGEERSDGVAAAAEAAAGSQRMSAGRAATAVRGALWLGACDSPRAAALDGAAGELGLDRLALDCLAWMAAVDRGPLGHAGYS